MKKSKHKKTRKFRNSIKKTKKYRKSIKAGNLKILAARKVAQNMLKNRLPISELEKQGYPSDIIELIKKVYPEEAAAIIKDRFRAHRPYITNYYFLKQLILRRIEHGEYTDEEEEILLDWIEDMEKNVLPGWGDEPHWYITKANSAEQRRLLAADLLQ